MNDAPQGTSGLSAELQERQTRRASHLGPSQTIIRSYEVSRKRYTFPAPPLTSDGGDQPCHVKTAVASAPKLSADVPCSYHHREVPPPASVLSQNAVPLQGETAVAGDGFI